MKKAKLMFLKRCFLIWLSIAMVFTSIPMDAFATETSGEVHDHEHEGEDQESSLCGR